MRAGEPYADEMRAGGPDPAPGERARGAAWYRLGTRQRAFTLIEVLAALIIVSLGMMGVIQAVGQTASNGSYLREKTLAHWVAMNRLTEARLQRGAPKIDKTSAEVDMAGRRWRWTMEVTQTPVEGIRRIDVSVRPAEAGETVRMASVSGFYGTAIASPGTTLISWQGAQAPDADEAGEEPPPGRSAETPSPQTGDPVELPVDPAQDGQ
jgi:general secretion pathway protein I